MRFYNYSDPQVSQPQQDLRQHKTKSQQDQLTSRWKKLNHGKTWSTHGQKSWTHGNMKQTHSEAFNSQQNSQTHGNTNQTTTKQTQIMAK